MVGVGVNCSNCDCSTRNCSTLLAGNQLLDVNFENCSNWINRIWADDKKFTTWIRKSYLSYLSLKIQCAFWTQPIFNVTCSCHVFCDSKFNDFYLCCVTPGTTLLSVVNFWSEFFLISVQESKATFNSRILQKNANESRII